MSFETVGLAYYATVEHLRQQGRRCMKGSVNDSCAYENDEGLHCAVGCHLSEGPWMSMSGDADDLEEAYPELFLGGGDLYISGMNKHETVIFWERMQFCHDPYIYVRDVNTALIQVANQYNIIPAQPLTEWSE